MTCWKVWISGVRSGSGEDYVVDLSTAQIPEGSGISSARVTFWVCPGFRCMRRSLSPRRLTRVVRKIPSWGRSASKRRCCSRPWKGRCILAQPYHNPVSGSLIALYVVIHSRAERGILVKLAGRVSADPVTGRLTVTFEGDPPLPFGHFMFHFREGAQAPLITPATTLNRRGARPARRRRPTRRVPGRA